MSDIIAGNLAALVLVLSRDLGLLELIVMTGLWLTRKRWGNLEMFRSVEGSLSRIATRRILAILIIGIGVVLTRSMLLIREAPTQPIITDEFSQLLLADTFRQGRLVNPVHPLWVHFETMHVLVKPFYASMYQPGQAVFLWAGWLLGHPWFGVLLSCGLMAAGIVWMLQAWVPERYALLGGIIVAVKFAVFSYWMNSYAGGAVPALGGALILGSCGRMDAGRVRDAALMGIGLILLGFTRPFEGLVFSVAVAGAILARFCRDGPELRRTILRVYTPVVLGLLTLGAGMLMIYCKTVTGSPYRLPYQVNQEQYGWPMPLPWQRPDKREFRHLEMRLYHDWEAEENEKKISPAFWAAGGLVYLQSIWGFYFGPALTIALLWAVWVFRTSKAHVVMIVGGLTGAAALVEQGYPHYFAPAAGCAALLIVECIRYMRESRQGILASRVVMLTLLLTVMVRATGFGAGQSYNWYSWCCSSDAGIHRARVAERLENIPGSHVIFVRYDRPKFVTSEWVYNSADIDSSRIVWVRDMGPAANFEVMTYYQGRRFWIAEADSQPESLSAYPDVPHARIDLYEAGAYH